MKISTWTSKDKKYSYTVTKHARLAGAKRYFVYVVSEFSLPNEKGEYMRGRVICECGNTKIPDNRINAHFIAASFCNAMNNN